MIAMVRNLALALCLTGTPALAQEFNDDQRREMGTIIRDYLVNNPEVLAEAFRELERRQREGEALRFGEAIVERADEIFRAEGDLVAGNPDGSITMVEFFDYNCGFCRRSMPDILNLIKTDKDLRVVIKEFPILGDGSLYAAKAALASRKQDKYWEFHLALMNENGSVNKPKVLAAARKIGLDVQQLEADMESGDVLSVIARNMSLSESLGISGTPAFVIGDQLVTGAVGFDSLSNTIVEVRERGCAVC